MVKSIAPSGSPIYLREILVALKGILRSQLRPLEFRESIQRFLGVKYVFLISSGRAGFTIILKALSQLADKNRNTVVIPAYTCFSVPSAIVRTGLKIKLCDIDLKTLDFDYEELKRIDYSDVLCIVPSNLFGLPSDLKRICEVARDNNVFVVDDAAQAFGAKIEGKYCGTFGDVGFFSLGRGKNITTLGGGIIVTNSDKIASLIEKYLLELPGTRLLKDIGFFIKSLVYSVFLHPHLYWLPQKLPFLKLGLSEFNPNFKMGKFSRFPSALGVSQIEKLDRLNRQRRGTADLIMDRIKDNGDISYPLPIKNCDPVYLRLPLILKNESLRSRVYNLLSNSGLGASTMYPKSIAEIPEIGKYLAGNVVNCPRANSLAERILTLPTHKYVREKDIDSMTKILKTFG